MQEGWEVIPRGPEGQVGWCSEEEELRTQASPFGWLPLLSTFCVLI